VTDFNIIVIAQNGRLGYETALFVASLRANSPDFTGQVFIATPRAGPLWDDDPRLSDQVICDYLTKQGAHVLPFDTRVFGQSYPHGNKIECLTALPAGQPFVFFDSDTLILSPLSQVPFDFDRPGASLRVTHTWPQPTPDGPNLHDIWASLYRRFDLDFPSSWDLQFPRDHWRRYAYFNAGYFYHRCPREFGQRYLDMAASIWRDPPAELSGQPMNPWLDQITLPLVLHSFGGGRSSLPRGFLDGAVSYHYRYLPLLYARAPNFVVAALDRVTQDPDLRAVLEHYRPFARFLYDGVGMDTRSLYNPDLGPAPEHKIRPILKQHGLWER